MAQKISSFAGKRLPPLPSIKDILQLYRLRALRQLSQNFLLDWRLNNKIVHCSGKLEGSEVCEIGPGPGNITRAILSQLPSKVIAIEKDSRFMPTLEMLADASPVPLHIIQGDVMNFNMEKMFSEEKRKAWEDHHPDIHIIGNLPFSISTPLIIKWLKAISERNSAWVYGRVRLTLTFQKEVAERMTAHVMSAQRCRLSIMCQNWCKVNHKFNIPGSAFLPKPDVDVAVVHFKPFVKPVIPLPFDIVEKVCRALFSGRQRYSYKGIGMLFPLPVREEMASEVYKIADIDPYVRPFQLTLPEIGRLCEGYKRITDKNPSYLKYSSQLRVVEGDWLTKENEAREKIREWRNTHSNIAEL